MTEFDDLREMIHNLSEQINTRFDNVDTTLDAIKNQILVRIQVAYEFLNVSF